VASPTRRFARSIGFAPSARSIPTIVRTYAGQRGGRLRRRAASRSSQCTRRGPEESGRGGSMARHSQKSRCTSCGDPLWGHVVHLKLDGRTQTFTDEHVPSEHFSGTFPFGRICALSAQREHRRRSGASSVDSGSDAARSGQFEAGAQAACSEASGQPDGAVRTLTTVELLPVRRVS